MQKHRKIVYMQLLTNGRLNNCLAEIDQQAQGSTEQLKAENAMEWVGRMNTIQACAREIMSAEIIYA